MALNVTAQETVYQVDDVSVINYGDGRFLFREFGGAKAPLNGVHRIINGYTSECVIASFKDGMFSGKYEYLKSNKLVEEGTYLNGRKDGIYKVYFSDGKRVKRETSYKEGKINGMDKSFYTNGELEKEKGYAMSIEDGPERKYDFESGKKTADMNYKDGKMHGAQYQEIVSNIGNFTKKSNYINGVLDGEYSETYNEGKKEGKIRLKGNYKAGKKVGKWKDNR